MEIDSDEVLEVLGIEIKGKGNVVPFGEIKITDGIFTYVMGNFDLDNINIDRIDVKKLLEAMIVRERTILATRGIDRATEKAKTAIRRRCYKEKELAVSERNYWKANDWFERMEREKY
jgi:hypothetical protein